MTVVLGLGTLVSSTVVMWGTTEGASPPGEAEWERTGHAARSLALEASRADAFDESVRISPSPAGTVTWARAEGRLAHVRSASLEGEDPGDDVAGGSPTSAAAQASFSRLPWIHGERAPDGLPVNALRCSKEGGCGECQTDSDCAAGKACVVHQDTRRFECMASECEGDQDCPGEEVCRAVSPGVSGPVVHQCRPAGVRGRGESCDVLFVSRAGACQRGLVCHRGVCSAPCRMEGSGACPDGFTCEEGLNGAACFPDCRAGGCAAGQVCKRLNDEDYQCLDGVEGQCPEVACGEGERCNMRMSRGSAVFWCARRCDSFREDACPGDQVCGVGGPTESTCYRRCDPTQPEGCGAGFQCSSVTEDMSQFGCTPLIQSGPVGAVKEGGP